MRSRHLHSSYHGPNYRYNLAHGRRTQLKLHFCAKRVPVLHLITIWLCTDVIPCVLWTRTPLFPICLHTVLKTDEMKEEENKSRINSCYTLNFVATYGVKFTASMISGDCSFTVAHQEITFPNRSCRLSLRSNWYFVNRAMLTEQLLISVNNLPLALFHPPIIDRLLKISMHKHYPLLGFKGCLRCLRTVAYICGDQP